MAMLRGILRGRRNRPPAAATRLRFTSGMPNTAVSRRDHQVAREHQLGAAGERRTVDGGDDGLVRSRCTNPPKPPFWVVMPPGSTLICLRSAPAQKIQPFSVWAPVRMPTHTSSSASSLVDGGLDALGDVGVDGVAGVGAVDGDDGDVALLSKSIMCEP
jgi:hypothetical protein